MRGKTLGWAPSDFQFREANMQSGYGSSALGNSLCQLLEFYTPSVRTKALAIIVFMPMYICQVLSTFDRRQNTPIFWH
jgi:hypothetical protein